MFILTQTDKIINLNQIQGIKVEGGSNSSKLYYVPSENDKLDEDRGNLIATFEDEGKGQKALENICNALASFERKRRDFGCGVIIGGHYIMTKDPESKKPLAIINLNQFQKIEIDEDTVRRESEEQPIRCKRLVAIAGTSKWIIADFDINSNHAENALNDIFFSMKEAKLACVINNWQE